MKNRRRTGLVLFEVLVAAAVVALIAALQLQGILNAREAYRHAQCTNNLKQIALAAHNYVATCGTYPMSATIGGGRGNGAGCFISMLPYMEQTALYNAYNFSLENWDDSNATAVGTKIATYICPSNTNLEFTPAADVRTHQDKPFISNAKFGPLHYGANWGGVRAASGEEERKAYPGSHLGVILTVVDPDAKQKTRNIEVKDITDGTALTLAFAEKRHSFGWGVSGWGGSEFDVFTAPIYEGENTKLQRAFTGSFHPGVAVFSLCDGSVQSWKDSMDRQVWYALTTRASGEKIKEDPVGEKGYIKDEVAN